MRNNIFYVLAFIILFFSLASIKLNAQGIDFVEGKNWSEVVAQAKLEKKLIFIDVYTDWCGPCKLMEDNVFPLKDISSYYNSHFVNFRMDAEKGEGIELKTKYEVKVYPTYLFIDPNNQELVHRSTSRQSPEVFLFTAKSATTPGLRSAFLEKQYNSGKRDVQLIKNYAAYLSSCYQRAELQKLTDEYFSDPDVVYTSELSWEFIEKYVNSIDHVGFKNLIKNRDKFQTLYGIEHIDKKILTLYSNKLTSTLVNGIYNKDRFSESDYDAILATVKKENFDGKAFLLQKVEILNLLRNKKYAEASKLADELPADSTISKEDLFIFYQTLSNFTRYTIKDPIWIKYALSYAQYLAYNSDEPQKAEFHYAYAILLEKAIRASSAGNDYVPNGILDGPKYGKKEYSLRPPGLKPKPKR